MIQSIDVLEPILKRKRRSCFIGAVFLIACKKLLFEFLADMLVSSPHTKQRVAFLTTESMFRESMIEVSDHIPVPGSLFYFQDLFYQARKVRECYVLVSVEISYFGRGFERQVDQSL